MTHDDTDTQETEGDNARRFRRADVVMEVHYRSAGSFLVSYSLNLSKGGLFLETDDLLPIGTRLSVSFTIPGAAQAVEGQAEVIWLRENPSDEGPRGLGLQFDALEKNIGKQIDAMISGFGGVHLMAVAGDAPTITRLSQYLHSVISCDVPEQTPREISEVGFPEVPDLLLLDLDSAGEEGLRTIAVALQWQPAVPVVAISRVEALRVQAQDQGAAVVLDNPPPFKQLRRRILEVLARPSAHSR
ncbi:MAG: TIGR02266 family protein [Deltaproteobacteria bacterium]|nr:TIGR02266 family protein [Deltaproteobacteria bacterium]